jgi:N-methylhydantoinase A/oxoprolinase/acetone carboxylase beta subunit
MSMSLAVDIGGTFTDVVLLEEESGRLAVSKVLTTYPDPSDGVISGVRQIFRREGIAPGSVGRVIHGTTLVTNTLIERKGARTALITTEGFRDALEIGREGRYDIYDLNLVTPAPLVERRLRFEAWERSDAQGRVLEPLDEAGLVTLCEQLRAEGVESVAVCFLHAYANPDHERQASRIIRRALPEVSLSLSHQVAPEWREFERTSTTAANAYVQPLAARYLRGLASGLAAEGVPAPLHIMLSNAGTCSLETAAAFPVRLVESGPAGGALAAAYWAERTGYPDVLAFDMGGTTAKAILGEGGDFPATAEGEVARVHRFKRGSGLPLLAPMLDMIEIGAGGGSIARLNELGLPAVGPESAGSTPGPACYGLGGKEPTVTDADLLLGFLNPAYFVGGEMDLDPDKARRALGTLAAGLSLTVEHLAWGINQLVNENMAAAANVHAAERGLDIRKYVLVATGGAGPVHASGVAERLGIRNVVVPPAAGVGSAYGMMLAPISFDFARTFIAGLAELDVRAVNAMLSELEGEGRDVVRAAGVPESEIQVRRSADMRYAGQGFNIRTSIPDGDFEDGRAGRLLQKLFEDAYRRKYGILSSGVPVQAVNWRVTVSGPRPEPQPLEAGPRTAKAKMASPKATASGNGPLKERRPVYFTTGKEPVETPVYNRYVLPAGFAAPGPAIVEEAEATTVVLPGWTVRLDNSGCLLLTR